MDSISGFYGGLGAHHNECRAVSWIYSRENPGDVGLTDIGATLGHAP